MGKVGTTVYERHADADSGRNSEGAFIDLKDGRIMYVYSHFIGGESDDWSSSSIAACFSADGGLTWTGEVILVTMEDDGLVQDMTDPRNIMSVSLLRMAGDDLGLFYVIRRGIEDTKLFLRRSDDEGATWSDAVCCTDTPGYNVVCNDRVVRLVYGRIIAPVSWARVKTSSRGLSKEQLYSNLDGYLDCHFHVSDDDGITWFETGGRCKLNAPVSKTGLQEPMVVELNNHVLWMLARTDLGRQYESYSMDSGESWTAPQPSAFTSACSPIMIKRSPVGNRLIAVWNPVPFSYSENYQKFSQARIYQKRSPLAIAASEDDGKTWSDFKIIDESYNGLAIGLNCMISGLAKKS